MKRSSTIPSRPSPTVSKARPSRGDQPRPPRPGVGHDRGGERGAVERLARTFHALGDPTRSRMVLVLLRGERCVSDLARTVGLSLSAASHQLKILRDLDIVRVRRAGKHQFYALNELAFGFCSPRSCHAWRHVLEPREPSRP